MKTMICTECGDEFQAAPDRKHLELCDGCVREKQQVEWGNTIDVETVQGDVLHFEVVRRFTVAVSARMFTK